jgi:rhodanese-related sulfurtransferase
MKLNTMPRFAAALLLAVIVGSTPAHAEEVRSVDVKQAQLMKGQGALLLDVREADEYASGHAPGSVLIPLGQLDKRLKEIEGFQNKPVVLICRSGRRSAAAAEILRKAGFSDARNVDGGMMAWEKAGLPVVQK